MTDVYATCIHEAGHAIGGLATGVDVTTVWAVDGTRGWCGYRGASSALCAMCGPVAEYHYARPNTRPSDGTLVRWLANGHRDLVDAALYLDGRVDGAALVGAWMLAREVVVEEWGSIVAVAGALQRDGRLSGRAVEAIWRCRYAAA